MDAVLLDTDVFSYLLKRDDKRGDPYRSVVNGKIVAVSFVTVGELLYGARKRGWGPSKMADLEARLRLVMIVPFDLKVCEAYAAVTCGLKTAQGTDRTVEANDRWIAACAIRHGLPLVTNNRRHFEGIAGLTLICEAPRLARPETPLLPMGDEPESRG
jgi:predicted nucleic acid-binding protein